MIESNEASQEAALATAPRWNRSRSLDLVHQLNEHCLELLARVAVVEGGSDSPLISANCDLWIRLDSEARKRAARMPFVILDLHFADEGWWRRVIDSPTSEARDSVATHGLPPELSERLVLETLMFAWQMARSNRTAAQVSFAMLPTVVEMIGALTPGQVRNIAAHRSGEIQLRWAEDSCYWRDLLSAAEAGDDETVAELHLHGKLLLLGRIIWHKTDSTM